MKDGDLSAVSNIENMESSDNCAQRNVCVSIVYCSWWRREMAGIPSPAPPLIAHPFDSPPPLHQSYFFHTYPSDLSLFVGCLKVHTHTHTHASVSPLCICARLQSGPLEMDQSRRSNDGMQAHRERRRGESEERAVKL